MGAKGAKRVLVVDDEPSIAESLADLLGEEGFLVQLAPDGRRGLEQVLTFKPDLVLLDVMMPEMDGLQMLRALQSPPYPPGLPVIIMTAAYAALNAPERDLVAGFLRKPFEIRHLIAQVEAAIDGAESADKPRRR